MTLSHPDHSALTREPEEARRSLADFFDEAYNTFLQAEAREATGREPSGSEAQTFTYRIAGQLLRMRFAGKAMPSLLARAFAHLRIAPESSSGREPDLTLCLWDSVSTGTTMPPPPWEQSAPPGGYRVRGDVDGFSDDRFTTAFHLGLGNLNMLDRERKLALYWVRDAAQIPPYETAMPVRAILHWWMRMSGRQLVHAAAVGHESGGALLAGMGGAGKSNTALGCLNSNLRYLSDDYCVVSPEPEPTAYSLYSTGRVHADDLQRLPFLEPMISNRNDLHWDKARFFLHEHLPHKLVESFPLRAILLPRVSADSATHGTRLSPAPSKAAFVALTPVTMQHLTGAGAATLQTIGKLVRLLPVYYLDLGSDVSVIPSVIEDLLVGNRGE